MKELEVEKAIDFIEESYDCFFGGTKKKKR